MDIGIGHRCPHERPRHHCGRFKIASIDLFPMRYPMTGYFKFFAGAHGSEGRAAVIVKVKSPAFV